ncbi:protein arginine N-methyltransferase 1-like isoform X1 [Octopus sinensis]|uniref:type I protein arginine methyltransferase n=2 Tax=Octopus sinensis TaxID=2607531 RepID=A0A7E6ER26_9MOLL|nr:protein arginine N-methyltransferase 1-like isoform X1 [Octopus sinensis]
MSRVRSKAKVWKMDCKESILVKKTSVKNSTPSQELQNKSPAKNQSLDDAANMNQSFPEDTKEKSITESQSNYFDSYTNVSVHELMIKDRPRTLAYKHFIENNKYLFQDKIVLDVGAGTGILSCFAAQAGAKKVYAVEASDIAEICEDIVYQNHFENQITVIHKPIEEAELDCSCVDVILSEWMGFYLLHESMLDSVLYARDKWLSPSGILLPSRASLHLSPVSMKEYHNDHFSFWKNVYGLDFSPMIPLSLKKYFSDPVIEVLKPDQLMSPALPVFDIDLKTVALTEIQSISKTFMFSLQKTGSVHGFACWFDVIFEDKINKEFSKNLTLSTSPFAEATHWKQTVFFLPTPLLVDCDDEIPCTLTLSQDSGNKRHYNICIEVPDDAIENEAATDDSINITGDDIDTPEQHSIPCNCSAPRCQLIKTIVEKYDDEQTELQNDNVITVTSEEMDEESEQDISDSTS